MNLKLQLSHIIITPGTHHHQQQKKLNNLNLYLTLAGLILQQQH